MLEHGRIQIGAHTIAYDARGSGEPLLLIPGLSMRRIMWPEELCDALASFGFRVIRIDNRDAGDSSRFDAPAPDVRAVMRRSVLGLSVNVPYRLEDMAEDAFGLMRSLGHERFHVAGASMGGMIAQTMARHIPRAELLVVEGMGHNFPTAAMPLLAGAIATHVRKSSC